ncbi:MAG: hypothetical protein OEQ28_05870 [Acidobacteriota bacterium]|nr:hypothetical protein [Acidobacteriota bacterium]
MKLEDALDRINSRVVRNRLLQAFTAFVRVLLFFSFLPPSIPKIMHRRFTLLPPTNPVGHYFEALYQTGFYYNFIGWAQLIAVVLLVIPRTSHIGALLFLPIIVNIAVLTTSVGFRGTWLITILMSVACLYLVCWDYPRWKAMLFGGSGGRTKFSWRQLLALPIALALFGLLGVASLTIALGKPPVIELRLWALIAVAGLLFGTVVAVHLKFMSFASNDDH